MDLRREIEFEAAVTVKVIKELKSAADLLYDLHGLLAQGQSKVPKPYLDQHYGVPALSGSGRAEFSKSDYIKTISAHLAAALEDDKLLIKLARDLEAKLRYAYDRLQPLERKIEVEQQSIVNIIKGVRDNLHRYSADDVRSAYERIEFCIRTLQSTLNQENHMLRVLGSVMRSLKGSARFFE